MSTESNKTAARRIIEEAWNKGRLDVLDEVCAPNFVVHDPATPKVRNLETHKQIVSTMRANFPDMRYIIEDVIAEGDRVIVRYTWRGIHQPKRRHVAHQGVAIYRFDGGKAEELWDVWHAPDADYRLGVIQAMVESEG